MYRYPNPPAYTQDRYTIFSLHRVRPLEDGHPNSPLPLTPFIIGNPDCKVVDPSLLRRSIRCNATSQLNRPQLPARDRERRPRESPRQTRQIHLHRSPRNDKDMRVRHEIQIPVHRGEPVSPRGAIPPVRNPVPVSIPALGAGNNGEVFESADVFLVVDESWLARDGSAVGGFTVEGLLDDSGVVIVADGLAGAAVGEDTLVGFCCGVFGDMGGEESV